MHQVGLDRFGAPRRQRLIVVVRANSVGVTGDGDGLEMIALKLRCKFIERDLARGPDSVLGKVEQGICRETHLRAQAAAGEAEALVPGRI